MPILLSSTKDGEDDDIFYDFELVMDVETGILKQKYIPDQNILYKYARNSGFGKTWETHYEEFYQFILKNANLENKRICEIGSGNGVLAMKIARNHKIVCYEPNPIFDENENITIHKRFFSESEEKYDIIISSHTLEHIPDINDFMGTLHRNLTDSGCVIMSFPNLEMGLLKKHINIFNTEHLSYFTPNTAKRFFNKNYFQNCYTESYVDHSIFIIGEKSDSNRIDSLHLDEIYINRLVENYLSNLQVKIDTLLEILKHVEQPLYIFGCHAMTSILLQLSNIDTSIVKCILDNDPIKSGMRLYGTNLYCKNPKDVEMGTVILNGAAYHNEILNDLIDKKFKIIEWM